MITFSQLVEGVYDPNIFKAIFLAGGPGSGKSYVAGKPFVVKDSRSSTLTMHLRCC